MRTSIDRKQFEEAVKASGLNTNARFICMMYAARNDYKGGAQESFPSQAEIAKWTGIHPTTVGKYVEALVEDGWLIPASMHGRTQGYYLAIGSTHHQQLKPVMRGKNLPSTSTDDEEIGQEASTDDVQDSLLMMNRPSTDGVRVSTDDEELITMKNHIEEPKEEPETVSDEPVTYKEEARENNLPLDTTDEPQSSFATTSTDLGYITSEESSSLVKTDCPSLADTPTESNIPSGSIATREEKFATMRKRNVEALRKQEQEIGELY